MTYVIETASYNERRYGKPWAAFLSGHLTKGFEWIEWNGRIGRDGEFRFDAEPGTMIARGQKDIRKGQVGVDSYYVLFPDGTMINTVHTTHSDASLLHMTPDDRSGDHGFVFWWVDHAQV